MLLSSAALVSAVPPCTCKRETEGGRRWNWIGICGSWRTRKDLAWLTSHLHHYCQRGDSRKRSHSAVISGARKHQNKTQQGSRDEWHLPVCTGVSESENTRETVPRWLNDKKLHLTNQLCPSHKCKWSILILSVRSLLVSFRKVQTKLKPLHTATHVFIKGLCCHTVGGWCRSVHHFGPDRISQQILDVFSRNLEQSNNELQELWRSLDFSFISPIL